MHTTTRRLLVSIALALSLSGVAQAQDPVPAAKLSLSAAEMHSIMEKEDNLIDERTRAEAMLRANPNDYKGRLLLGYVLHHSEGDLARACYNLEKAHDGSIAEISNGGGNEAKQFFIMSLWELLYVLTEMDKYQEKIDLIDETSKVLNNDLLVSEKAWPLMKLGREEEARAIIQRAMGSSQPSARINAWNTLGALESDLGHYQASYDAFDGLNKEMYRLGLPPNLTFCRNMGEACLPLGRYEEAERYYVLAASQPFQDTSFSNPYQDLTKLYLGQARFSEAIESGKKMISWSNALKPFLYQQNMAENTMLEGTIYLELGLPNKAVDTLQLLVSRPDRRGGTSVRLDQAESGNLLCWRTALQAKLERNREVQAATGFWRGTWELIAYGWKRFILRQDDPTAESLYVSMVFDNWYLSREIDKAGKRIAALAADNSRIRNSMLPYDTQSIQIPEWLRPNLLDIWGRGLSEAAINSIIDNPPERQTIIATFLTALQAELSYLNGSHKQCIEKASAALQSLPPQEALLRLRVQTRLGQSLLKRGETDRALQILGEVINRDGTLLRTAKVRLPVKLSVETDSSLLNYALTRGIKRSPRFKVGSTGLALHISSSGEGLKVALADPSGNSIKSFTVPRSKHATDADLLAAIHDGLCSPNITVNNLSDNLNGENASHSVQELIEYH